MYSSPRCSTKRREEVKEHLTEGGWEWYLRQLKEKLERPLTPEEIHTIMQEHYIKGYSPERALEDLKSD